MNIDEKIKIIKTVAEELINEEELRELFEKKENPIAYDGFEPSGQIHIAQGLLRALNVNKLTSTGIHFKFWVADYFAMLNNKYSGDLDKIRDAGKYAIEVWKSCGMNLDKVEFIWTSQFYTQNQQYWETVLKLSMNATVARVLKCGQIMGREESTSNPSSQIIYPIMQAADIHHLQADIAQLGMDQRKVNMLARDIFPKLGFKKPIALHHHMLMGLQFSQTDAQGIDRKIAMKMSKSKPETAIFMTDTKEEIEHKFKKAYCIDGQIQDNPVLEYAKYIIFETQKEFHIDRPEKFGGSVNFNSYEELEQAFLEGKIKSIDLKAGVAKVIDKLIEPTRKHFEENKEAKELLQKVKSYSITR
ncbi:tyrosine--tRNA ligase [Candidatus Woesearchaeota archaeon]|nr:tyrosine--tRNA ligase [Nanoarchaeota archaeon]MCB9371071.1 tyrosine--tRNA ligase [Candidatus Woesearchaeota archaeon]USN44212.1 MAG: tyrosine--tRNA ligase [Candidatus Woesearchaeota archaeon]